MAYKTQYSDRNESQTLQVEIQPALRIEGSRFDVSFRVIYLVC